MPVIPLAYIAALLRPTWREFQYGLDHGLVAPGTAPAFARMTQTGSELPSSALRDLADCDDSDPTGELVGRLAAQEAPLAEERIAQRWYALSLLNLWESVIEEPLSRLEEVYCSFDHPEELAAFISFMSARHPEVVKRRSREENIPALEDAWRDWAKERPTPLPPPGHHLQHRRAPHARDRSPRSSTPSRRTRST